MQVSDCRLKTNESSMIARFLGFYAMNLLGGVLGVLPAGDAPGPLADYFKFRGRRPPCADRDEKCHHAQHTHHDLKARHAAKSTSRLPLKSSSGAMLGAAR